MNHVKKSLGLLLALIVAAQLAACSKTVQWEEEVPLNTGETIWVKRTVVYAYQGAGGNPFDMGYRPKWVEKLQFEWGGKKYVYEGDASIMLLAISPNKQPVLIAPAAGKDWNWEHHYKCTVPFYVQLVPDAGGRTWTWPEAIEPWLFGLRSNLMLERHSPEEMKKRYTTQDRDMEDKIGSYQGPYKARIDPNYKVNVNTCFKGE